MNLKGRNKRLNDKYCEFSLSERIEGIEDKFMTCTERVFYTGNTMSDLGYYERGKKANKARAMAR